ncbi:MAG: zinc ribbon domain-containing protein [Agathobacter sp.]|nr:zinc ribbon domain-containing protein [Agathobacter sp.]
MAFEFDFNKVKESLVNAGKEVESKAKDVSAVAKIKIDIHNKEVFLEKQYTLLGKAFYEAHKDEDVEEQVYFTSIKEAEAELAKLNADLLAAQGSVECPSCGSKQPQNNAYCADCGAELSKSEEI